MSEWNTPHAEIWKIIEVGSFWDRKKHALSETEFKLHGLIKNRYDSFEDTKKWHKHLRSLGLKLTEDKGDWVLSSPDPHTEECWVPLWIVLPTEMSIKILTLGFLP